MPLGRCPTCDELVPIKPGAHLALPSLTQPNPPREWWPRDHDE